MSGTNRIYDNVLASLRTQTTQMARLQEQAATGQRLNRASDAPADAALVLNLLHRQDSLEALGKNLNLVTLNLEQAASAMEAITESLGRIKQLLSQAASETFTQKDRQAIGEEIDILLEDMVSQANTEGIDGYLFSGSHTSGEPYRVTRNGGRITAVEYSGSNFSNQVPVGPGVQYANVLVGDSVFRVDDREAPQLLGTTGAVAGSATSSVRGDLWLTLAHTLTTYGGATGLAAGASSAAGDTILGTGHTLTLNADAQTLSLDGATAVSFDPAIHANLPLTNADGDVVYVDTTGLAGGLSGTIDVALTATGTMSIDDGAGTAALSSFSDNQSVTDPQTGRVLYVDATDIARIGTEPVVVAGTHDLFGVLISARDVLLNTRDLSVSEQTTSITQAITSVTQVSHWVVGRVTSVGAQLQALDSVSSGLTRLNEDTQGQIGALRDADAVEVATELARVQTFYEMALMAAAKVMKLTLLDYM